MADNSVRLAGTAFFISRNIPDSDRMFTHVVTARHVIDGIRAFGIREVLLRINCTDGVARWLPTPLEDWVSHPSANNVDVAVFSQSCAFDQNWDQLTFDVGDCATDEVITREEIGLGSEVFVIGLFSHHFGRDRNLPIVRTGNIAAMPEEPVQARGFGSMDVYLIEARSIGGLSGSPVFWRPPLLRRAADDAVEVLRKEHRCYLLGIVHGHFEDRGKAGPEESGVGSVNVGIGIVVPAHQIIATLQHPKVLEWEEKALQS